MAENLKNLFTLFTNAVINGDGNNILPELKNNGRISRSSQVAVYIDGYIERMSKAIESDYPALQNYFQTKNEISVFKKLVVGFIKENPSGNYNLDKYPLALPGYIKINSQDVFAYELASLESLIAQIFMAEDSDALNAVMLSSLDEESLGNHIFNLRRAGALVKFSYDVEKYLSDFRNGHQPDITKHGVYLYLVRHNNEVRRNRLERPEYEILNNISSGNAFNEALSKVTSENIESEILVSSSLSLWLGKWLIEGFFRS